ncbi:GNAT family N-acetyltransferase [Streptomyces sp. GSL17-111]|uniref:GNAT family N-acetyltransferase n=1 Tax=Streptomyces sp. GSL17-111 TaxID=3121596 RepID=UPI0030F3E62C
MTTTLRPTGAETQAADGGRSRTYAVCVNGRPVGGVRLATAPPPLATGFVRELTVDPAERRRGRATVAVLAAEEILRGQGCRRVRTELPADAEPARRLAASLGYHESNRHLAKELTAPPPALPPGSVDRRMSEEDFAAWQSAEKARYARTWAREGLDAAEAAAKADHDHAAYLPDGPRTPGSVLRVLAHDGVDVGTLWLAPDGPTGAGAYLYTVRVEPGHRGKGHGRTLLRVAERECLAAGVPVLTLNVFTANTTALGLYTSLGYRATHHHYAKQLL